LRKRLRYCDWKNSLSEQSGSENGLFPCFGIECVQVAYGVKDDGDRDELGMIHKLWMALLWKTENMTKMIDLVCLRMYNQIRFDTI